MSRPLFAGRYLQVTDEEGQNVYVPDDILVIEPQLSYDKCYCFFDAIRRPQFSFSRAKGCNFFQKWPASKLTLGSQQRSRNDSASETIRQGGVRRGSAKRPCHSSR